MMSSLRDLLFQVFTNKFPSFSHFARLKRISCLFLPESFFSPRVGNRHQIIDCRNTINAQQVIDLVVHSCSGGVEYWNLMREATWSIRQRTAPSGFFSDFYVSVVLFDSGKIFVRSFHWRSASILKRRGGRGLKST